MHIGIHAQNLKKYLYLGIITTRAPIGANNHTCILYTCRCDAVKVTTDLASQSPATIGVLLCQLQTLKCL